MVGGYKGFDKVLWEVIEQSTGENPSITFKYTSDDGEEGTVIYLYYSVISYRINVVY